MLPSMVSKKEWVELQTEMKTKLDPEGSLSEEIFLRILKKYKIQLTGN